VKEFPIIGQVAAPGSIAAPLLTKGHFIMAVLLIGSLGYFCYGRCCCF
jgi:hypothetical protein